MIKYIQYIQNQLNKVVKSFFNFINKIISTLLVIILFVVIIFVAITLGSCNHRIIAPMHKVKGITKPAKVMKCHDISKFQKSY